MVVGFDFTFSYPAWFLKELGIGSAPSFGDSLRMGKVRSGCIGTVRMCDFGGFQVRNGMGRSRRSFVAHMLTGCCGGWRRG